MRMILVGMTMVQIEGLVADYGAGPVLRGVDVTLAAGQLVCLLGPSGCGKSTLLRCLAGFMRPRQGRILFAGRDVTQVPPEGRNVGMVFQQFALWPHRDVGGNVAFPLEQQRLDKGERGRRVSEALTMVGLTGAEGRLVGELSGGQQQRVALARALVGRPRLLLLDEPLASLDARLRLELRDQIRELVSKCGLSAIMVTHDQSEALAIADEIAILDQGRVAQIGTPAGCYHRPRTAVVARFLGDAQVWNGPLTEAGVVIAGLGVIALPAGAHILSRESVQVCVRPECVRPGPGPAGSVMTWTGTIRRVAFEGPTTAVEVELASGFILRQRGLSRDLGQLGCGKPWVGWCDREDVVVLEA